MEGIRRPKPGCSLAEKYPELAKEWHPTKNGVLTPDDVSYGSVCKVWWLWDCGHEWEACINDRSHGRGCPTCSKKKAAANRILNIIKKNGSLADNYPELAAEWYPTKNGDLKPEDVTVCYKRKVYWKCSKGHVWEAWIRNRTSLGAGCPYCKRRVVVEGYNDLATLRPELTSEWDYEKNSLSPTEVSVNSVKSVYWKCRECGRGWKTRVSIRTGGSGCPVCKRKHGIEKSILSGIKKSGSLYDNNPLLASEWHPVRNGSLTAKDVAKCSGKKVWWKCALGHEWMAKISSRSYGSGCPVCWQRERLLRRMGVSNAKINQVLAKQNSVHKGSGVS